MVVCEFSGEECDKIIKVEIAGAIMNVSSKYAHLGKIIEATPASNSSLNNKTKSIILSQLEHPHLKKSFKSSSNFVKTQLRVVDNAVSLIQSHMSKNNLTIKHISHNANVKEGTLQKMLSNKIQFDIKVAQQIQKTFKISLVEEVEINEEQNTSPQDYIIDDSPTNSSGTSMEDLLKGVLKNMK
ncbi:MAG: hypothetical protein ACMXYB_01785 [Candidatus Woesearchaeota archaeon]